MARKKKRRSTAKKKSGDEVPGWAWGVFGLGVGLAVALAVWVSDRRAPAVREPATAAAPPAAKPAPAIVDNNGETDSTPPEETVSRFDFYKMLPQAEVDVGDIEPDVIRDDEPVAVIEPGRYVLQAGSFSTHEDADRRRAELALHGIESRIQRVTINNATYHRVRIGPTSDLDELNMLRSRLRAANIDVMRIRFDD